MLYRKKKTNGLIYDQIKKQKVFFNLFSISTKILYASVCNSYKEVCPLLSKFNTY